MGDRCYMSVTCRREDQQQFEDLGFHLEFESSPESLVIEMVDEEANHAHFDEMPTDIPYIGWNGSAGNYGDGKIACDGKQLAEVSANNDGFAVKWDYKKSAPTRQSLKKIREFIKVHSRAEKIFAKLRQKEPHKHRFSPHTDLCNYCGIHADDDAVENQPCPR
jgi:hypothetical protein